jgi:hypothetical protein
MIYFPCPERALKAQANSVINRQIGSFGKRGFCLKERRNLGCFGSKDYWVEKNLGEQGWKLANFVRQPKLLITKVSA